MLSVAGLVNSLQSDMCRQLSSEKRRRRARVYVMSTNVCARGYDFIPKCQNARNFSPHTKSRLSLTPFESTTKSNALLGKDCIPTHGELFK